MNVQMEGARSGGYRIVGRIGVGGMAEVLEAERLGDAGFVRRVAIKRMLASASEDRSFVRMFLDEARIASHLHHANIVAVLDYGVVDGAPFQVLELVDGCDARALLRQAAATAQDVPVDIALYIAAQVGYALAAAHRARDPKTGAALGIVHRDVTPGNVLLSWDGDVKLADFGIAFARDKAEKTEAGTTKGTLAFMSPEQAITGRVDERADVFSLGCVLHALLCGASPVAVEGFSSFLQKQQLKYDARLPADDVLDIIEMATRYDPARRFQSAEALTEAIGAALAKRATRDPRRRLMELLAPQRQRKAGGGGKLDALMRVDILPSPDSAHEYRTVTVAAPIEHADTERVVTKTKMDPPAARRSSVLPILAALLLLLLAAGVVVFMKRRPANPILAAGRSAAASSSASFAPSASIVEAPASPTSTTSVVHVSPPPSHAPTRPHTHRSGAAALSSSSTAAPPPCLGVVYLSCPAAPRSPIAIDGRETQHHHGEFVELSCGAHTVKFVSASNPASISIQSASIHTRVSPLEARCLN